MDKYFTPGPVEMSPIAESVGVGQLPYFRTASFSKLTKECESLLLALSSAPQNSRIVFLAASGTGAMDAAIANLIQDDDISTVINAGGFGQRFVDILSHYGFRSSSVDIEDGESCSTSMGKIKVEHNLIYNLHETTTGALHDIEFLSERSKNIPGVHIVDAISSFLCDDINMERHNIDALILSSQKALALPPGLSMIILSPKAIARINKLTSKSYYFDLKEYLINGERGQTPYTPAVSIMMQLHARLQELSSKGYSFWVNECRVQAVHFREEIKSSCFSLFANAPSNAVTALSCKKCKYTAIEVVQKLEEKGLLVTPNGGNLANIVFRVGHMGCLNVGSYDELIESINSIEGKV